MSHTNSVNSRFIGSAFFAPVDPSIYIRRIKLNRNGYTEQGSYYGCGAKVWIAIDENSDFSHTFRANDLQSARAYMRSMFDTPDLKFTR